jgi:hypothetical protein
MSRRASGADCAGRKAQCTYSEREWRLAADDAPPLGSHVVTARRGYTHHGIFVGDGRVVHYAGLSRVWRRGPVEEVSLDEFARGRPVRVRPSAHPRYDRKEVVARARSRLGEDCYRVLSNNCEHFCEWSLHGEARSRQVEAWRARPRWLLAALFELPGRWLEGLGSRKDRGHPPNGGRIEDTHRMALNGPLMDGCLEPEGSRTPTDWR